MADRSLLGAADVDDDRLLSIVAADHRLDRQDLTLESSRAERVDYDVDAIFTAGRYWVSGTVGTSDGPRDFRYFVKHVQAWSRSTMFQQVPPDVRAFAARMPWRSEVSAYRSGLADRLPEGFRMPRVLAVDDLDEESAALWLEAVPGTNRRWDAEGLARVARLLGRLAASRAVGDDPDVGRGMTRYGPRDYLAGRLTHMVIPAVLGDAVWYHPVVAAAFDPGLRDRLRAAATSAEAVVDELDDLPVGNAHGDACSNNLLVTPGGDGSGEIVLVDYGFWCPQPLGFDLGQLLVGDLQVGRRTAAELVALEPVVFEAYVAGLRDEGCDVDERIVRRAHALQMPVFFALSAIPFELLGTDPTPRGLALSVERAGAARFVLDLVDATGSYPPPRRRRT